VQGNGFAGGPRQVSLQLKPWNSPVRQSALPSAKAGGAFNRLKGLKPKPSQPSAPVEPQGEESVPVAEPFFESVGSVLAAVEPQREESAPVAEPFESVGPVLAAVKPQHKESAPVAEPFFESVGPVLEQAPEAVPAVARQDTGLDGEAASELTAEPIGNDQPHETIFAEREAFVERENFAERESFTEHEAAVNDVTAEHASDFQPPPAIPVQPVFPQPTIPATMPETTQTPPAPIAKAPAPPVPKPQPQAPVPVAGMQTSVQLTFSFEIAAMQLTPSFKMGVLKVRPISKLVTMRLPSPQRAQSPLNLQVAFEVVKIQPVAGALGTIRVVPSQQQRPAMGGMPSFAVAGLQVVPNSETAPVQLTPSPQGRASVFVTVPFQISTLEFSPTLEIGSVTLNSNSKQVVVQLPGTGPGPVEGAPMFEIANLELNEGGEIVMMQLNLLGGPKRA
jgi:hypothetical protein